MMGYSSFHFVPFKLIFVGQELPPDHAQNTSKGRHTAGIQPDWMSRSPKFAPVIM